MESWRVLLTWLDCNLHRYHHHIIIVQLQHQSTNTINITISVTRSCHSLLHCIITTTNRTRTTSTATTNIIIITNSYHCKILTVPGGVFNFFTIKNFANSKNVGGGGVAFWVVGGWVYLLIRERLFSH